MCGCPEGPGLSQVGLWGPARQARGLQQPSHLLLCLSPFGGQSGRASSEGILHGHPRRVPCLLPCRSQISTESFLHLRYQGTDCALMVSAHQHPATARSPRAGDFGAAFVERCVSSASWEPGAWPAGPAALP